MRDGRDGLAAVCFVLCLGKKGSASHCVCASRRRFACGPARDGVMCALLVLVVLTSQLRSTSALLAKRPPECVGGCVSEDTSDLRSLCPVNVLANVMTRDEADALVQEAEAYAAVHGWTKTRHHRYETTDLPWTVLPGAWPVLNRTFDAVESNVRKRCNLTQFDRLSVNDIFLVRYAAGSDDQPGLARHRDSSFVSFNVGLSDPTDYEGGGTRVYAYRHARNAKDNPAGSFADAIGDSNGESGAWPKGSDVWGSFTLYRVPKGHMLVHGGKNFHAGAEVTGGTRYIIAGFIGLNRHCCQLKYAGMYGGWQLARGHYVTSFGLAAENQLPNHDVLLMAEFRALRPELWLWRATYVPLAYCAAVVACAWL